MGTEHKALTRPLAFGYARPFALSRAGPRDRWAGVAAFGETNARFSASLDPLYHRERISRASRQHDGGVRRLGASRDRRRQGRKIGRAHAAARPPCGKREPGRGGVLIARIADVERRASIVLVRRAHPSLGGAQRDILAARADDRANALSRPPNSFAARQEVREK